MNDNQPDQLIVPHSDDQKLPSSGVPEPDRPAEEPESTPAPAPAPEVDTHANSTGPSNAPASVETGAALPGWQYHTDAVVPAGSSVQPITEEISWTAAEFVEHQKNPAWYGTVLLGGLILAGLVYLISQDKISVGVIVLVTIGFCLFAARRPETQEYHISSQGIEIGTKAYSLHDFKTFSVTEDGDMISIVFMPLKRFMPPLTVCLAPDVEDQVVDLLSSFMPFEQFKASATDSFLRRIRF